MDSSKSTRTNQGFKEPLYCLMNHFKTSMHSVRSPRPFEGPRNFLMLTCFEIWY